MNSSPLPFARLKARVLLPAVLLGLAAGLGLVALRSGLSSDVRVIAIVGYLGAALAIALIARYARLDWRRLFGAAPSREMMPLVTVVVPVGAFTLAAAILVFVPLSYVAPGFVERQILTPSPLTSPTSIGQWVVLMVVGVIAAPFVEEVLFRGLLLQRWAHRWGTTTGVVTSSALFAVLHDEWLGHFVIGAAFALLYLRTRTLWMPIVAHATNNFIALLGALPGAIAHRVEPVQTLAQFRADVVFLAPLLALAIVTGWLWVRKFFPAGLRATLRGATPYEQFGTTVQRNDAGSRAR